LSKNDELAARNRSWLESFAVFSLNLMSSPGAGKTCLLEKTLAALANKIGISVLVGDLETRNDARRLEGKDRQVHQINTHASCHLDADLIHSGLHWLNLETTDLLLIENVGNLVCPAAFDLGQTRNVTLLSCTEGEDKPQKYPGMFHRSDLILLTKVDLLPYLDWNLDLCLDHIRKLNPKARVIQLSSRTGEGMDEWLGFLQENVKEREGIGDER